MMVRVTKMIEAVSELKLSKAEAIGKGVCATRYDVSVIEFGVEVLEYWP